MADKTMDSELIELLHYRIASTSVGPSTARRMGPKGTVAAARDYLSRLHLATFNVAGQKRYRTLLNRTTRAFMKQLPQGAQNWGPSRKFLNIFLRDVLYNRFLCEEYGLYHIEPWLEVPLDSQVAKGLRKEPGGSVLPRWRNVVRLDLRTSQLYQDFASEVSEVKGISRVHLDLFYWRRAA